MKKKKILFIEDEKELVMLMKTRLEAGGYEMIFALDGEEGLRRVRKDKPDIILLDLLIPNIDGLTLCKRLKADIETKDIPVIVVTASGGKKLPERCSDAGADDYILKPFEAKELLDKIAKWINK
jgi:CheY-like chemotaxis protein